MKLPRSGGLALPKDQAQTMMHLLALKRAEPDQLKALYQAIGLGRGIEGSVTRRAAKYGFLLVNT